ncbi:hypothetical protein CEXT_198191 [Caerostris extrusa]|uniref:Uncharacterized protein n=1 Tax=Caerostris extrusa TaxID=172846 RepID=A0AAV4V8I8_CAEEX|nr:hypothetical protein CEXT_198191 [Caerostris extrusa]
MRTVVRLRRPSIWKGEWKIPMREETVAVDERMPEENCISNPSPIHTLNGCPTEQAVYSHFDPHVPEGGKIDLTDGLRLKGRGKPLIVLRTSISISSSASPFSIREGGK